MTLSTRYDFVPGDKVLFHDDFTDMADDAPPPHWQVRGASVVLVTAPGIRQLTSTGRGTITPMLTGLPKNFTLEAEVKFEDGSDPRSKWFFLSKSGDELLQLWPPARVENPLFSRLTADGSEDLGEKETSADFRSPVKVALWVQDGRARVYVNGEKAIDVNQLQLADIGSVSVE